MIDIIQKKWKDILFFMRDQFDDRISDVSYNIWLKPLKPYKVIDDKLYILAMDSADKNNFVVSIVTKKFADIMEFTIEKVTGLALKPVFISEKDKDSISEDMFSANKRSLSSSEETQLDFNRLVKDNGLNPKYTFYTFVKGKSNELAQAAAVAVAENPGYEFKILYIYGGVGLGKTHLMHAIAIYVLKNNPRANIIYTSSEGFTNEYIDSLKKNTTDEFRIKYRSADLLLIDDIQFIANKESTQEEFFNTFNALFNNNKQIVITSDKPPKDINNLEDRIKSRFEGGMVVDIQVPDYETRMAILRKKEEIEGYNFDDEVLKFIATNFKSNIRLLEGALQKTYLKSKLEHTSITIDTAKEILKDMIGNDEASGNITPEKIINVVAEHYRLNERDLMSSKKNKELAYPRQIIMYLCCELTDATQKNIGAALGGRDHATIVYGRDKITAEIKKDEKLKNDIDILKKKIEP